MCHAFIACVMWREIMKLKKEKQEKVLVTVKDRTTNKTKSMTIYECTMGEVFDLIQKTIEANAT